DVAPLATARYYGPRIGEALERRDRGDARGGPAHEREVAGAPREHAGEGRTAEEVDAEAGNGPLRRPAQQRGEARRAQAGPAHGERRGDRAGAGPAPRVRDSPSAAEALRPRRPALPLAALLGAGYAVMEEHDAWWW